MNIFKLINKWFETPQCKYCGGELEHYWHTSSKEINICKVCKETDEK